MSGVMDPTLELQQLAAQAINYQNSSSTHLPPAEQIDGYDPESTGSPQFNDPDAKFYCPFPTCNRHYKRKDLLKRHLTTLLASPDEHHQDQDVWERVREEGTMTIYTRPRNLTEDQKKQRRKDSNLRHRIKYAQELKEKRNRKRRVEKLLEGKQIGVQTPDWEAEAREQAQQLALAAQMQTIEPHYTTVEPVPVEAPKAAAEAPAKTGRRAARARQ